MLRLFRGVKVSAVTPSLLHRTMSSDTSAYQYETLTVTNPKEWVFQVELNRPDKRNAMNRAMWKEIPDCFEKLALNSDCRSVVISGSGKMFTAGIDIMDHVSLFAPQEPEEPSRRAVRLRNFVHAYQRTFTAIEKCPKPVIAAIHNACIGGGIDLVTACDIRYASRDAFFCVKEVDVGLAADVGTLQRLPKVVGSDSLVRELVYTARNLHADEALSCGLVSRLLDDRETLLSAALELAALIASKSPVAVQGSKVNLVYSRDHSVADALDYVATWNASMLQSEDTVRAGTAFMSKEKPVFSKL